MNKTEFVRAVYPAAEKAWTISPKTTPQPLFITAQAALESGWTLRKDFVMFGIKATSSWKGKVIESPTWEYLNGVKTRVMAKFRAYDTLEDSLADNANLWKLRGYSDALPHRHDPCAFAEAIVDNIGYKYATDPNYATKMKTIIKEVWELLQK